MSNKKNYTNKCFSPNWLEVDLKNVQIQQKEVIKISQADDEHESAHKREECLGTKQRKDLNTLLKELGEIKQNIERVAEKQHRLANLMRFYTEGFA